MGNDRFVQALQDFTDHQPAQRVLLVPSRSVGQRLLAQAARTGVTVAGVTAHSIFTLATELCTGILNGPRPRRLLTRTQTEQLVQRLLWEHRNEAVFAGEFWQGGAAARAVWRQLEEAALARTGLPDQAGLNALAGYLDQALRENGLLTRPMLYQLALEQCQSGTLAIPAREFARVDCVRLTPLENELWQALTNGQETVLPLPGGNVKELSASLQSRCRFVACWGTENEVRWIFQDLIRSGKAPDSAAVAVSSPTMAMQLWQEGRRLGLDVAVDGGLPLSMFPLAALLRGLDRWRQHGYEAETFLDLLQFPGFARLHPHHLARQLHRRQVVFGKDRYARLWSEDDRNPGPQKTRDSAIPALWQGFFGKLFAALTPGKGQKEALAGFLTDYARPTDKESAAVLAQIQSLLAQLEPWPDSDLLTRLLDVIDGSRCLSSGPRPGALFCAGYAQCLGCGAEMLYVTGLSAAGMLAQPSPLPFGGQPPLPRESPSDQVQRLLFSAPGRVALLYPAYTVEDLLEQSPALLYTCLLEDCGAKEETFGFSDGAPAAPHAAPAAPQTPGAGSAPAAPDLRAWLTGTTLSATALETAIHCPYRFMLQYVLGIREEQSIPMPRTRWLEVNDLGTLVHKVLQDYFDPAKPGRPDAEKLLEEQLAGLRSSYPPAPAHLMQKDAEKARALVQAGIGSLPEGSTVLATEQNFSDLTVQVGKYPLRINGSIDRLDQDRDGGWTVVDYKTGRMDEYRDHPEHHVQPLLYSLAAEELCQQPGAVCRARYLGLANGITVDLSMAGEDRALALRQLESLLDHLCGTAAAPECNPCLVWQQDHWQPSAEEDRGICSIIKVCPYKEFCSATKER